MRYSIFFLVLVIFISGCVEIEDQVHLLDMSMMADSETVFTGSKTTGYLDINNNDVKSIKNVVMDIFETGYFTNVSECYKEGREIKPGSFDTLTCELEARSTIPRSPLITTVHGRVRFDTRLSAVQIIEMITEDEYILRERTGELAKKPETYSYSDNNLELQIDFSEELPVVVREGEEYRKKYMYLTIRNVGNGFVSNLEQGGIEMRQEGDVVNEACIEQDLSIIGKEFPRIACEMDLPGEINYLSNYVIILDIDYNYELREELSIEVIK